MFDPSVKYPAQKFAVLPGRYAKVRNIAGFRIGFDALNELQEPDLLLHEKIKYLIRVPYVMIAKQYEYIELYLVLLAPFDRRHHPVKRALTGKVHAMMIMKLLRAIQAYPHKELILMEKLTPLIVKKYPVSLQCIGNHLAIFAVFPLKLDNPLKEVKPHQCRFAPLPRKTAVRETKGEITADEFFEYLIAHPVPGPAEKRTLTGIKTIAAIDITVRSARFDQ